MSWTVTNLAIQFVAGVVGAHLVALILKDHAFGFFGHTISGAIGSALSGTFLQSRAVTMVTAGGTMNPSRRDPRYAVLPKRSSNE
jgi:uncharacterized membrane protein YeaQ/YmgE (transglycosylase-associated protein family)